MTKVFYIENYYGLYSNFYERLVDVRVGFDIDNSIEGQKEMDDKV